MPGPFALSRNDDRRYLDAVLPLQKTPVTAEAVWHGDHEAQASAFLVRSAFATHSLALRACMRVGDAGLFTAISQWLICSDAGRRGQIRAVTE
jgi:hypothetical protein